MCSEQAEEVSHCFRWVNNFESVDRNFVLNLQAMVNRCCKIINLSELSVLNTKKKMVNFTVLCNQLINGRNDLK